MNGMKRRTFIRHLLGMLGLGANALAAKEYETAVRQKSPPLKLATVRVAGLQYGACENESFAPEEPLKLVREPQNPHDHWAVRIECRGRKAGYIPHTHSRIVASLMDGGYRLRARVRYYHPESESWERLWVSIWMEEKA